MTTGRVVTSALHRVQRGHGKGFAAEPPPVRLPVRRPARVAVMLALGHKLQERIATGQVRDQNWAAGRIGLTRARLSQFLYMLRLAPDLQERVLFLESVDGFEPLTERRLRAVTRTSDWVQQRMVFDRLVSSAQSPAS